MSTDAVLEFKFGDGTDVVGMYVRYDSHEGEFDEKIKQWFKEHDDVDKKEKPHEIHRMNWDWVVSDIVGRLITEHRNIRLLAHGNRDSSRCIYHYVVTPIEENYTQRQLDITECFKIEKKT